MASFDTSNSWVPTSWLSTEESKQKNGTACASICNFGFSSGASDNTFDENGNDYADKVSGNDYGSNESKVISSTTLVAREMSKLTAKERADAYDDVHGVRDVIEETPELLRDSLDQLTSELQRISNQSVVYQTAVKQSPAYLENKTFRLLFLRATEFDIQQAALRIHQFLEQKLELFGPSKLTKEITLADMSPDDMTVLESGAMQLLPVTDRTGRPVVFVNPLLLNFVEVENYLRTMFYIFMTMVKESVDAQRKGWVALVYHLDIDRNDPVVIKRGSKVRASLPMKQAAAHICSNSTGLDSIFTLGLQALTKLARTRVRFHHGSSIEIRYALRDFGIPTYALPIQTFGSPRLDQHAIWIQRRKELDLGSGSSQLRHFKNKAKLGNSVAPGIDSSFGTPESEVNDAHNGDAILSNDTVLPLHLNSGEITMMQELDLNRGTATPSPIEKLPPQSNDVLLGRGVVVMNHPGNLYYRNLIASHSEAYDSGSKFDKTVIAEMIIKRVKDTGGRFLKPLLSPQSDEPHTPSQEWEEIDYQAARLKVASAFRFVRKQKKHKAGSPN